jgi:hypothetical protein
VNYHRIREALPSWALVPDTRASTGIERAALHPPYRAEIDGLRALAVIPVVLYHAGFDVFSGGFVGVDVFLSSAAISSRAMFIQKFPPNIFRLSVFTSVAYVLYYQRST